MTSATISAQDITNEYPSPPEDQLERARQLFNNLALEEAYQVYNFLFQDFPENGEVLFGLALTTEALGDKDQALIYYNMLDHFGIELPEVYMNRGKIRYYKNQYEAALEDFIFGAQLPLRETRILQFKGLAPSESSFTQFDDMNTAASWANEFKEWKAKSLLALKRLEEALLDYQELILNDSSNSNYFLGRSEVYLAKGNLKLATEDLKKALLIDPGNEQAKFNLLQLTAEDVTEEDLLKLYDDILSTSPDIAEVFMNKGIIHYKQGDYHQALENINRAIELNDHKGIYYFNLALVLNKQERFIEANENLREAINLQPDHAPSWAALGNNFIEMARFSEAIDAFQLALFYDSTNPIYHFNRGVAFQKSARLAEACSDFRIAANMGLREAQEMTIKLCGVKN